MESVNFIVVCCAVGGRQLQIVVKVRFFRCFEKIQLCTEIVDCVDQSFAVGICVSFFKFVLKSFFGDEGSPLSLQTAVALCLQQFFQGFFIR